MDGQSYLDQISTPAPKQKSTGLNKIFSSKIFMFGMGALVLLIIIIIIGGILSGSKSDLKNLSFALKLHLDNTTSIIDKYQKEIKSSALRSSSSSLNGVLSDVNTKLTTIITEKYDYKEKNVDTKIVEQATLEKDGLDADLFEAKINGNLDRIYAHKMAYEITVIGAEESKILNSTNDNNLKETLTTSYDSLLKLYDSFNNFSETK